MQSSVLLLLHNVTSQGFLMEDVIGGAYGDMLTFWNWKERTIAQQIKMHGKGLLPLENRFLHDPDQAQGFTGAALSSNIIHFCKVSPPV